MKIRNAFDLVRKCPRNKDLFQLMDHPAIKLYSQLSNKLENFDLLKIFLFFLALLTTLTSLVFIGPNLLLIVIFVFFLVALVILSEIAYFLMGYIKFRVGNMEIDSSIKQQIRAAANTNKM